MRSAITKDKINQSPLQLFPVLAFFCAMLTPKPDLVYLFMSVQFLLVFKS